jgi:hypothetical protein
MDHSSVASFSDTSEPEFALCKSSGMALEQGFMPHVFSDSAKLLQSSWEQVRDLLPNVWKWDVHHNSIYAERNSRHASWTCTPLEPDEPKNYPLSIADAPVVLPVEYQWPPIGGVTPPPDPRPSEPIDCRVELSMPVIRYIFLTFEGSIGFYLLINGLLQIIVPTDFDTTWASSHLPHKYGGLKVCYVEQTLEATVLPSTTHISKTSASFLSPSASMTSIFRPTRPAAASLAPSLKLNDFIEARPRAHHRKDKYSGRIGLKVAKEGDPYVLMSTHVITEAILAQSHRDVVFGRNRNDRCEKLEGD